jgi:hypothetical protein
VDALWAEPLFRRIAIPRMPGSAGVRTVESAVEKALSAWGYKVRFEPFDTSDRRLHAPALAGAALGWVVLVLVPLLLMPVAPGWVVAIIGFAAIAFAILLGVGAAEGRIPVGAARVEARNLVATRGTPTIWFVAHSDSKGQRISLRGRMIAAVSGGIGVILLGVLLMLRVFDAVTWVMVGPIAIVALFGAGSFAFTGGTPAQDDSPGAVDNASGIIAVLAAAEALKDRGDVGVLITGAEEFGLEGARAWIAAGHGAEGSTFVNFDGLDVRGTARVATHGEPGDLARRVVAALRAADVPARAGRLPPGVYMDGIVLANGRWSGVSVMRGDWRTLGVVHTKRDTAERTDPNVAVRIGRAAATAVRAVG